MHHKMLQMTAALGLLALAALPGCTQLVPMGDTTVSSIMFAKCPPGTKVSGEISGGGGFGAALAFGGRFDCDGGPATPAVSVPTPTVTLDHVIMESPNEIDSTHSFNVDIK